MDSLTTRESLIHRVGHDGDPAAWAEFCRLYQPLIRTYVGRFRPHDHDADDLVQEIFLKLQSRLREFRLDGSRGRFRAWLRSLTDNTVRDWLRSRKRRQDAVAGADPQDLDRRFADETDAGEADRSNEWRQAVLDTVLARVRSEFAERAKVLACFEQCTLKHRPAKLVAAELGIESVNTVYVYAHRVLQRVRAMCAEYDEELSLAPA
jgi:RNA polymerase sigma factor (sigma-70 family)